MAHDLYNEKGDHFHFTTGQLGVTWDLAKMYGWKPGILRNGEVEIVPAENALALARALEQALDDIPDHDALEHLKIAIVWPSGKKDKLFPVDAAVLGLLPPEMCYDDFLKVHAMSQAYKPNLFETFSGEGGKQWLCSFITFCRQGRFGISMWWPNEDLKNILWPASTR